MKTIALLLMGVLLAFAACKKSDIPSTPPVAVNAKTVNDLKSWYASQKSSAGLQNRDTLQISDTISLIQPVPDWDSTKYYIDDKTYITPLKDGDGSTTVSRSLVVTADESGNFVSAEFIFIRLTYAPNNLNLQDVIASYPRVFEFHDMPMNFKASMIKFNLAGEVIFSRHFENGMITATDERIRSLGRAPNTLPDGTEQVCIDSWWVTYVNGEVVSIEFLWTNCYTIGGTGGTGGGTGTPNTNTSCEQQSDAFIAAGHAVSGPKSIETLSETQFAKNIAYKWRIYDAFTWFLTSIEDASLEKVYTIDPNTGSGMITKRFLTFSHRKIYATGASYGGTRTFIDLGATINFSPEEVSERIDFTVTHSPLCLPANVLIPPQTLDYSSTGVFVANLTIVDF
jgi:hypothetical protein